MDGGDRRLNRIGTEPLCRERLLDEPRALGDMLAIPERSILIFEQDHLAVG